MLWVSIVATIVLFYPVEQYSAFLLLPYLFWVTFAAALNLAIWRVQIEFDVDRLKRPYAEQDVPHWVESGDVKTPVFLP